MKHTAMWLGLMAAGTCLSPSARAFQAMEPDQAPFSSIGHQAVTDLSRWYDDTRADCGGPARPALFCTGVMLRSTFYNPSSMSWDLGSVDSASFSWLRFDTKFAELGRGKVHGFVLFPRDLAVGLGSVIKPLCVFPTEADSDSRDADGCGASLALPASRPCEEQDIRSPAEWLDHFAGIRPDDKSRGQCGWGLQSSGSNAAAYFHASIAARAGLEGPWWRQRNEVRLAAWSPASELPIRAFFYLDGEATGLAGAQLDQKRYKEVYGAFVPIVRVKLPTDKQNDASFAYVESEQVQPDPGVGPGPQPEPIRWEEVDFEPQVDHTASEFVVPLSGAFALIKGAYALTRPPYFGSFQSNVSISSSKVPFMTGRYLRVVRSDALGKQKGDFHITYFDEKPHFRGIRFTYNIFNSRNDVVINVCNQRITLTRESGEFEYICGDTRFVGASFDLGTSSAIHIDNLKLLRVPRRGCEVIPVPAEPISCQAARTL